jgi:hypothetical protein
MEFGEDEINENNYLAESDEEEGEDVFDEEGESEYSEAP